MNAVWVLSVDNETPARACTALECTVSGQFQVSLRSVSVRSVFGQSQAIAMNAVWVLSADNEPPARACTAFECTGSYIS